MQVVYFKLSKVVFNDFNQHSIWKLHFEVLCNWKKLISNISIEHSLAIVYKFTYRVYYNIMNILLHRNSFAYY